jgi:putative glutamine amidotransferase
MPRLKTATVSKKPTIGIFTSIFVVESGLFPGMERSYVNYEYISAIEATGAIPLLIPVVKDEAVIRRQVESVDALLLTGGYDPSPLLYGENPSRQIGFIFPEIDEHQLAAIRIAADLK